MRFQSSVAVVTPLALAGAAVVSAENNVDVVSSSHVNSLSTTNEDIAPMKRRLLQKIKKRNQIFGSNAVTQSSQNDAAMPDVGILSSSQSTPRFLQEGTDDGIQFFCPRTTCPSVLCDCAEEGGSLERCSKQLTDVCLAGKLQDCVFSDYIEVYTSVYCPFTFCLDDGFEENQCDCAFYDMYCGQIQEDKKKCELLKADGGEEEKMPFFGCDETDLADVCDQAKSCKDNGDLKGLPIEEWKTVAYRMNGAGGRGISGVVVGALGLLSAFLFLLNN